VSETISVGDWLWSQSHSQPARVVEVSKLWGSGFVRIWLSESDVVVKTSADELQPFNHQGLMGAHKIIWLACGARIAASQYEDLLLAPIGSAVIPLPHQLKALNKAVSSKQIRYLLADEVGLGKTIEAGLIIRELKLRGLVKRVLVVAPKGLLKQWVSEMRTHFAEQFTLLLPGEFGDNREQSPWQRHNQVICPMDSIKPMEKRRGWSMERVAEYNRKRFDDVISAGWDLIVVDEAHRLQGSTEQVARYKLGQGLADAAPYLLLLSATPHQGKSDGFHRLVNLLDSHAFPDEASVTQQRVQPFVIRTEKTQTIDGEGKPLFRPRRTQLVTVDWQAKHAAQQQLYESVTDYVREGYNQAKVSKQNAVGFLMILMQRLVTSSPAAIRATLARRLDVLNKPSQVANLSLLSEEEWEDLDGQQQVDELLNTRVKALTNEKAEVQHLLTIAEQCVAQRIDAKADALMEWITRLQQEENDPELKVLVFTEFVPTQQMLAQYFEDRGFSVVLLNGSLSLDQRRDVQEAFAADTRVLISTDAGGEGLNLQFCHVVINYDIPWNPMRLEQRIGRVDRIGQPHVVRALNFVFGGTVEHRVRDVLEEKLAVIFEEFGVDKTSDVLDNAQAGQLFDELYTGALQHPEMIDEEIAKALAAVRQVAEEGRASKALLSDNETLDHTQAQQLAGHPLPYWVERMTCAYLQDRAEQGDDVVVSQLPDQQWRMVWPNGERWEQAVFQHAQALKHPASFHATLEEPNIRQLFENLPYWAPGQTVAQCVLPSLPSSVDGLWSLWQISLTSAGSTEQRYLPIFQSEGKCFATTATRIWEVLLSEGVEDLESRYDSTELFSLAREGAEQQGGATFEQLQLDYRHQLRESADKADYAFSARRRAIERIGLAEVRQYRAVRLEEERSRWQHQHQLAQQVAPELRAVLLLYVQGGGR
tara:strand:- start:5247 stop:8042 length:2796 start_codon:yes stop_codon:yes gene_type:complete